MYPGVFQVQVAWRTYWGKLSQGETTDLHLTDVCALNAFLSFW